ncbi:GNAT family N-acetyltransferase [Leptolyngbya sp. FACHB-261]|nr:GNAT family N-acetyltransferase [Leptolyngbya sp. FACHB-261]
MIDCNRCPQLTVRPARARDLPELADLLTESFHPPDGWMMKLAYPLLRLGIYEDLRSRLRRNQRDHVCLVATCPQESNREEILLGTVELALGTQSREERSHPYPYLSNLAVRPQWRRQGVAQQLLVACEQIAQSAGQHSLYLHVLENNYSARKLYSRIGYRLQTLDQHWSFWVLGRPRRMLLCRTFDLTTAQS